MANMTVLIVEVGLSGYFITNTFKTYHPVSMKAEISLYEKSLLLGEKKIFIEYYTFLDPQARPWQAVWEEFVVL